MTQPAYHSGLRSGLQQADIILALSLATDLGTGRPMEWAMRSALLGVRLGESLGLSEEQLREVYYCALLAYVGCTSEIQLAVQLFGDDPAKTIASVDFVDPEQHRHRSAARRTRAHAGEYRLPRGAIQAGTL